ncbi:MAG: hypothetical protein WD534_02585 [Phycisphaeraceae bacterium]
MDQQSTHGQLGTGYFEVCQDAGGQWTLVDPDGRPFLFKGVCGVNRAGTQGGRLARPGPYAATVDRKYDYPRSPQRFVDATLERLRDWNFNALGSWVTEEFFDQGMPFTEILECVMQGSVLKAPGIKLPDVFDPAWHEAIDRQAQLLCTPLRNSRELIGYFTDNELSWGQPGTDQIWGASELANRKGPTLLQAILGMEQDCPARREAWAFVLENHGSMEQIGRAWDVALSRPEDVTRLNQAGQILYSTGYGQDHHDFSRKFAHAYVRHTAEAIRRHDPNHLILGARFGSPPGEAVLQAFRQPWVDVVSANNYRVDLYGRMNAYWQGHEMPLLVGEFAWASPPFVSPDHWTEQDRADGESVESHVQRVGPESLVHGMSHPGVVGYTWYRWIQDRNGRPVAYGLVDTNDEVNPLNVDLLTEVNARLESLVTLHHPAARAHGGCCHS